MASGKKSNYKEKLQSRKTTEDKPEDPELPKYRDRAKERREDVNPDYELTELASFHAVAPPGAVDLRSADALKISIENSKYLGGDVEHTHLVKGLDYALLHKVRSEIDKRLDTDNDADKSPLIIFRVSNEEQKLSFRTELAKSVFKWTVKPQTAMKQNEMFLPGRMAFVFNMEGGYTQDIPTTVHRSKADCPVPEEMVTVSIDGSVLDRIAKIMSYLRLGSSGKVLKKKKKDKDGKARFATSGTIFEEEEKRSKPEVGMLKNPTERDLLPPPPPPPLRKDDAKPAQLSIVARIEEDDIFVGDGIDYEVPCKDDMSQSPVIEDMVESPKSKERPSYFDEPAYGPVPPSEPYQQWQQTVSEHERLSVKSSIGTEMSAYDALQAPAYPGAYQGEWQDYQYADQLAYPEQYLQQSMQEFEAQTDMNLLQDPHFMTQEEKDRGLGSVFKRDDQRLQQLREKDDREKDPNFISESYSECYPGYQEYNREVVDSDDEADLSKMDMGGRAKGRLHRWDFETEEEWATYNEQKEAMPKAAFQFGVKMQDGRKTRKQNKDQKLTNELHKITKILARKNAEKGESTNDDSYSDEPQHGKKLRI